MNCRPPRVVGPAAFTLLEVLIAVMVFSIVLAAVNTVFYGALQLRNRTTLALEDALPREQTLAVMRRDLRGVVSPGGTLAADFTTASAATSDTADASDGPRFYSNTGRIDSSSPWADVQQIRYYLRAPTNAAVSLNPGRDLIRATRRNLLAQTEEPAVEERLLSGVDRLEFLFYSGTEWRESWDSTEQTNTLPRAVKVRLRMAHAGVPDGLENPLELVVPLAPQTGTNQSASTGGPA